MTSTQLFCRLFKIPCPLPDRAGDYLNRLAGTSYEVVGNFHRDWHRLEEVVGGPKQLVQSVREFEDDLIGELGRLDLTGRIVTVLRTAERNTPQWDRRKEFVGRTLVSFDLAEANYQTAHHASPGLLPETWSQYLTAFVEGRGLPQEYLLLAEAKVLRQRVFGEVVGATPVARQSYQTGRLAQMLADVFRDAPVQRSPDELTYVMHEPKQFERAWEVCQEHGWRWRQEVFSLEKIPDGYLKLRPDPADEVPTPRHDACSAELFGVPGTRFYVALARHVLREEPIELDRLFLNEGHLARWVD